MKKRKNLIFLFLCFFLLARCVQLQKGYYNSIVKFSEYENNENFNLDFKIENE